MYAEELKNGKVRFGMSYTDNKGKSRRVSVTMPRNTATYRREAELLLNSKIRKALSGQNPDKLKLGELAELYYAQSRPYVKEVTYIRNKTSVKAVVQMIGADINVSKLTAKIVSAALYGSGRDNSTLNEFLRRFKAFMRWSYDHDYVDDVSWLSKLKPFPAPTTREKNRDKYLERDELQMLLPQLYVRINRYVVAFLALSGLRIGECLALTQADVNLKTRIIRVNKTYNEQLHAVSDGAKTYSGNRNVYMQDELYSLCAEVREYYRRLNVESDLFFCDLDGKRLSYARLNKYFAENTKRVIGRRLTLHSLRHTHASLLFEQGISLENVAARLGHSSSKVTRDIYTHVTSRKQEIYNAEIKDAKIISQDFPIDKKRSPEVLEK